MRKNFLTKTRIVKVVLILIIIPNAVTFFCARAVAREESQSRSLITIEAESSRQIRPPMVVESNSAASAGKFIEIPQGAGNNGGQAIYRILVNEPGRYTFWGRVKWNDGCGNSLTLIMDGRRPFAFGQDGTYRHWHWVKLPIKFKLSAGKHTLIIKNREDGVKLDQFILTADKKFVPVGIYRAVPIADEPKRDVIQDTSDFYFADDFTRTEDRIGVWDVISGLWEVNSSIDPNGIPNYFSYIGRGNAQQVGGEVEAKFPHAISVTGHDFWKNYSFSVMAKSFKGEVMGICLYFHSPSKNKARLSYYLLRWESNDRPNANIKLLKVVDGKQTVLAKTSGGYVEDEWYKLRVEIVNGNLRAFVNEQEIASASDSEILGGRIGLYVEGKKGAYFDNVQVEGIKLLLANTTADAWKDINGNWQVVQDKKGKKESWQKIGSGGQQAAAKSIAGEADWSNYSFEFAVHSSSFGAMFYYQNEKDYYLFRQAAAHTELPYAGKCQIVRLLDGKEKIVAEGSMSGGDEHNVKIEIVDGYIQVDEDGKSILEAVDFTFNRGKLGLYVESKMEATFNNLRARLIDPQSKVSLVDAYDFFKAQIIDASDFADFSKENKDYVRKSGRQEYYRKEENFFPLVGNHPKSIWKPWTGYCGVTNGELTVTNPSGKAILWYSEGSLGDAGIEFVARSVGPHNNIGVTICGAERRLDTGYSLSLGIKGMSKTQLLRNGQVLLTSPLSLTPQTTYKIRFEKRGRYITAFVNGKNILAYEDKSPLIGDKIAFWTDKSNVRYDDVKIYVTEYSGLTKYYPFYSNEPDWRMQSGRWILHSGITCIPGSHWIVADARSKGAVIWNKLSFDSMNVAVRLAAFEYSEWYGWDKNPTHEHFPYRNIGVTICGDGKDIGSGYNFIVGGWNNSKTCILKGNKIVAQTRAVRITLRSTDIRVVKEGNLLTLYVDGVKALNYKDEGKPLKGSRVALWSWGGCVDFRDVFIHASNHLADSFSTQGLAPYDVTAFVRSIQ